MQQTPMFKLRETSSPTQIALHNLGNAIRNTKYVVPANLRMWTRQFQPNPTAVTEKDFSEAELNALRSAIITRNKRNKEAENWIAKYGHDGDDIYSPRNAIDYTDYNMNSNGSRIPDSWETSIGDMIKYSLNPNFSMSSTIGKAYYEKLPNGNTVLKDRYDFGSFKNKTSNPLFRIMHSLGANYGHPYPVNINLGNI